MHVYLNGVICVRRSEGWRGRRENSHVGAGHDPLPRLFSEAELLQECWESDAGPVVL